MSNNTRTRIIEQLASGDFCSGEQLGNELGISRAAISKHIQALTEMGLDIFRVTGKGYCLSQALNLFEKDKIIAYLAGEQVPVIEIFHDLDSTNSHLLRKVPHHISDRQICITEFQHAGRGRRGRQWISPFASNIYFSQYRFLEQGMSAAMGLSIVAAIAVFDTIKELYHHDVQLKWPNDVYLNNKKLAGILIDLEGQPLEACHCVIGIGINLAMPENSAKLVDQPWSDLSEITDVVVDRNQIVASLSKHLNVRFLQQQRSGLSGMLDLWHQHDIYFNQPIKIITGSKQTFGICRGVDGQGALLMEIDGVTSPVYGGEVSLRPAQ
ncbi:MAG: bifunctional biotin--[acetyl-CoA-carboxylase] ligase/biotin operon repressor BirA [Thalassotalea sp.]